MLPFTRLPAAKVLKGILIYLLALCFAGLLGACAGTGYTPRIQVEDNLENRSRAESYNFITPLAVEEADYPEAVVMTFQRVIAERMDELGYERSSEPDLLINAAADLGSDDGGLESDPYQAIHPQRGTFHDSWRGYGHGYGASHTRSRFEDGRILVGIIDSDSMELVWEGLASGRIGGIREEDAMVVSVENNLALILADLPPARSPD